MHTHKHKSTQQRLCVPVHVHVRVHVHGHYLGKSLKIIHKITYLGVEGEELSGEALHGANMVIATFRYTSSDILPRRNICTENQSAIHNTQCIISMRAQWHCNILYYHNYYMQQLKEFPV